MPRYAVRLIITFEAPSPGAAVRDFIEQLEEHDLSEWVYGVMDANGQLVGVYDADGDEVDLAQRRREAEAADDDDDDDDDNDDAIFAAANAAGFYGDVTHKLRNVSETLAAHSLRPLTFDVSLRWAGNHDQPIVAIRYEVEALAPQVIGTSVQLRLMFRGAGGKLLASNEVYVFKDSWISGTRTAVYDASVSLLNMHTFNEPLAYIDVAG